ncbi:MAG TPA: SAM-dependent methyltransferase [Pseudonocardiaceae bacterium]|jgi:hypothetical protein
MTAGPGWNPPDVDLTTPSVARVYDYYLGGAHNFEIDRVFAEKIIAGFPEARDFARHNRGFLQRAVRTAVTELGVTQFIDLGAGIPTAGPTHETARCVDPAARTLYVDNDPVAVAHTELILARDHLPATEVAVLNADLRKVRDVLAAPQARAVLDLDRPVAVVIMGVLHFLADEENPADLLAAYLAALPAGSCLIASHATGDGPAGERVRRAADQYAKTTLPGHVRSRAAFEAMVTPLVELIDPGITWTRLWRSDDQVDPATAANCVAYAAVGVKR